MQVTIDLGSIELVHNKEVLLSILESGVLHIIFCNREEARSVAEVSDFRYFFHIILLEAYIERAQDHPYFEAVRQFLSSLHSLAILKTSSCPYQGSSLDE